MSIGAHQHSVAAVRAAQSAAGYTLIETLVALVLGLVVTGIAFSLLSFTLSDVSRINERATVDQNGLHVIENLMLQLHSACVAPEVTPIREESSGEALRFISEENTKASLEQVELHEVIYKPASGNFKGSLVEKSWLSSGTPPNYTFPAKATTPNTTLTLVKGVKQFEEGGKAVPVFRYYGFSGTETGYLSSTEITGSGGILHAAEAAKVVKMTVAFTVTPEANEPNSFKSDRPVSFEDSAIFRLSPSSETSSATNIPCTSS